MGDNNEPSTIVSTKTVKKSGNALVIYITTELKLLGLDEGDFVEISLKKAE